MKSNTQQQEDPSIPLELVFDSAMVAIAVLRGRQFIRVNQQLADLFGFAPAELLGRTTEVLYPDARAYEDVGRFKYALIATEGVVRFERPMKRRTGDLFWCRFEGRALRPGDLASGTVWILQDVSSDKERRERSLLHAGLFENSAQAILITDAESRILSVNRAFTRITGYTEVEVLGRNPNLLQSGRHDRDFYQNMWASLEQTGQWHGEIWNRRRDGSLYPELLQIILIRDENGRKLNYVGFFSDLSRAKQTEERLHHLAHHDALTGLPNRATLVERLGHRLEDRTDDRHFAVIALDLNQFKRVNESAGMLVGDRILTAFAERLARAVVATDLTARLEGDDFLVVHEFPAAVALDDYLRKLVDGLSEVYDVDGVGYHVRVSVGVSVAPEDGSGPETLVRYATIAQNRGRRPNQNTVEFFRRRMNTESVRRLKMEIELREALSESQLVLHYQPVSTVAQNRVVGFEALVRWQHPQRGLTYPGGFLGFAEQMGCLGEINRWVLREAIRQARAWCDAGILFGRISVNCSADDIASPDFPRTVQAVLDEHQLSPELLTVELTETTVIQDVERSARVLSNLRDMGVSVAMDDFGTGYSSLNALRFLPVEFLKLDRSFIQDLPQSAEAFAMVRAVNAMCQALGLTLVAEGVETTAQLALLREIGCERFQGYLRSPAVPPEEVPALLGVSAV